MNGSCQKQSMLWYVIKLLIYNSIGILISYYSFLCARYYAVKCLYQCDVLPVDLTSFNIIHSDFVKHSIIFFVTIFISIFSCTCYRYKTFIQYQKKKERKNTVLSLVMFLLLHFQNSICRMLLRQGLWSV